MTVRRHKRIRSSAVVMGSVAVAVVAAAATAVVVFGGTHDEPGRHDDRPPATTEVTRMTLTETETVDGTLGYGDPSTVTARTGGTITWLPAEGGTVARGKPLYRADEHPVVLLYGGLPLYRKLVPGVSGDDVRQFEQNLAAVGYKGFAVDRDYNADTEAAVKRWQSDLGLTGTGQVDVGWVAYAPGAVRITELKAHVGDAATGPVLTYTGTTRTVAVALDVGKQQLVRVGVDATVTLPGGKTVAGKVTDVGTVAHAKPTTGTGNSNGSTIDVTVSIADQAALGTLDRAPVQVDFVADQHKDVLTVPVGALLALAEGGYGLQVVDGATTRIVPVRVGLFAGGRVEVSGEGIVVGTVVGVPK